VPTFRPAALAAQQFAGAISILDMFRATADPCRFPWLKERREPTEAELALAIGASAALIAGQRVQTMRRNSSKAAQEREVKEYLASLGFKQAPTVRAINTLDEAPPKGAFCAECAVGSRKADVPVRLFDGRLMPVECKVSNSALNSIKRINNDAAVKAQIWRREFGTNQVVPAAMLSGVFDVGNLLRAQDGGLTLFWAHRLDLLGTFIESTKAPRSRSDA